jgi:hypothetical protein
MKVVFYQVATKDDHITELAAVKYDMSTGKLLGWFAKDKVEDEMSAVIDLLNIGKDAVMATYLTGSRGAVEIAIGRYFDRKTAKDWAATNKHLCVYSEASTILIENDCGTSLKDAFEYFVKMKFKQPKDCQDHVAACIDIYFAMNPVPAEEPEED